MLTNSSSNLFYTEYTWTVHTYSLTPYDATGPERFGPGLRTGRANPGHYWHRTAATLQTLLNTPARARTHPRAAEACRDDLPCYQSPERPSLLLSYGRLDAPRTRENAWPESQQRLNTLPLRFE
eukprot:UN3595